MAARPPNDNPPDDETDEGLTLHGHNAHTNHNDMDPVDADSEAGALDRDAANAGHQANIKIAMEAERRKADAAKNTLSFSGGGQPARPKIVQDDDAARPKITQQDKEKKDEKKDKKEGGPGRHHETSWYNLGGLFGASTSDIFVTGKEVIKRKILETAEKFIGPAPSKELETKFKKAEGELNAGALDGPEGGGGNPILPAANAAAEAAAAVPLVPSAGQNAAPVPENDTPSSRGRGASQS